MLQETRKISQDDIDALFKNIFTGFTYEIKGSSIYGNTVEIVVKFTNKVMTTIETGLLKKLKAYAKKIDLMS